MRRVVFCLGFWVASCLVAGLLLLAGCRGRPTLFRRVPSSQSGIGFVNRIVENDSVNPLSLINLYNGGGVGIGDFNRDGRPDIYFTGSLVSNQLYLNEGDFHFRDVTLLAGVTGEGRWSRGVAVVDINNDGWPDIYVCTTIASDASRRRNLLYINQGTDKAGVPHFREMAAEYGLADTSYSTMAAFFDYDNDGDLDVFIAVNTIPPGVNPGQFRPIVKDGSFPSTCRLYRNEYDPVLHHPVFRDVSRGAGILQEGYSHGVTIADLNRDGWEDIYVSNDFISENVLYINNHDGTFTNRSAEYFKHTAANAMGQDIVDINNDGLADVVELDMNPQDNYRKKMMLGAGNYRIYQNSDLYGYQYQYVRNVLQLNRGPRPVAVPGGAGSRGSGSSRDSAGSRGSGSSRGSGGSRDSAGSPVFSDIGFYSGIAETDWSWTPAVADFDNDGYRDIIITNGYPKDVTDHDFTSFLNESSGLLSKKDILRRIPEVKLHKYAYRNLDGLRFADVSADWGLMTTAFSNGTVYADLDGDGDLDLVMNNINDEAMIFRNLSREKDSSNHYLQIRLTGDSLNRDALGTWIRLCYDHGKQQVLETTPYRGYLSTMQNIAHFGLGSVRVVDSVVVRWPGGRVEVLRQVAVDRLLTLDIRDAGPGRGVMAATGAVGVVTAGSPLFRDVTDSLGIHYKHEEYDFIDFNVQKLLPHKLSEYGPALAAGDINGDGLDDFITGGSAYHSAQVFIQQANGRFVQKALLKDPEARKKRSDDLGLLIFDADGDGDPDLYIASGGYESAKGSAVYADRLYINDGKGNFHYDSAALPLNLTSKLCVRAADFDHDGDPDLFVSGRVAPGLYPQPVSSYIYRNDSRNGKAKFTDVTAEVAPALVNIGMVCDALWTDFDGDGWPDLMLAGEWMPITLLKNQRGRFVPARVGMTQASSSGPTDLAAHTGWWNSITAGDFDNDGDIDYIVGNLGLNSFYRASAAEPVRAYAKDFDNNGIYDLITSLYLPDSTGTRREFPADGRDDLLRQMNSLRRKFPDYRSFALATMDKVLTPDQRQGALILECNDFRSSMLRNDGNGRFTLIPLPPEAQWSALNGMAVGDYDGDGNLDVLINGNDYGGEPSNGRYDAMDGLLLAGDGKGGFVPRSILESGVYIPGNGKGLVRLRGHGGSSLLAAGQNRDPLKLFALRHPFPSLTFQPSDVSAMVHYRDGRSRKEELYWGASFLSQSARFVDWTPDIQWVDITNVAGRTRRILK